VPQFEEANTTEPMSATAKMIETLKNNIRGDVFCNCFCITDKKTLEDPNCKYSFEFFKKIKDGEFDEKTEDEPY